MLVVHVIELKEFKRPLMLAAARLRAFAERQPDAVHVAPRSGNQASAQGESVRMMATLAQSKTQASAVQGEYGTSGFAPWVLLVLRLTTLFLRAILLPLRCEARSYLDPSSLTSWRPLPPPNALAAIVRAKLST